MAGHDGLLWQGDGLTVSLTSCEFLRALLAALLCAASFNSFAETVRLPDSGVFEGSVVNGLFEGRGTIQWRDGSQYVGEFKQGLMHGTGKYTHPAGYSYEGEYEDARCM